MAAIFDTLKEVPIFTIGAFLALVYIGRMTLRETAKERMHLPADPDDGLIRYSIMASREDLKLIALLLMGILIMLGIIADRIR
jgi:hypothetical protein